MADRMLFIGWGATVRGREERAIEVFNDAVGFYGRMQQEGRIESFDVALLDPIGMGLAGYIQLHGTSAQLSALRGDAEFRKMLVTASMIVDDLRLADGYTGPGVAREMALFQEVTTAELQHA